VPNGTNLIGDVNRAAILRVIASDGPISRSDIARRLRLSPATVTAVTRQLLVRELIAVVERAPSRGGRPALLLGVVPAAAQAVGVKIAADHVVGVRVNLDADVLETFEEPFDARSTNAVSRLIDILRPRVALPDGPALLLGVGLGVPGVVGGGSGRVTSPLLGWEDVPIAEALETELGVPVLIDNDVNTLAIDERLYGRGRDVEHFVTITIGRGVGLGIVVGGDVYRGAGGAAGEFGHVTAEEGGAPCECGKRGCLEALVSDPALVRQARERSILEAGEGIERLRELADGGHRGARAIYARAGTVLGRAVGDLVNVLSPGLVLVSGEGTQAWPHLAPTFDVAFEQALFTPLAKPSVEIDPWDDAKWATGAAALVLRATFVPAVAQGQTDELVRARLAAVPSPAPVSS
jgi:predicted NBD/HSP70 family sugar kinase